MKDQLGPAIRALAEREAPRRHWRYEHREPDESKGLWYFECVREGDESWCIRQIAPYFGAVSAYDWEHLEDEHGFLTDHPIAESELLLTQISADEFDLAWTDALERRTR
jgi:hypothetical protein